MTLRWQDRWRYWVQERLCSAFHRGSHKQMRLSTGTLLGVCVACGNSWKEEEK